VLRVRAATGRRRRSITKRNSAEQWSEQGQPGVEGRVAAERLIQVVLKRIVNPCAGAHGPDAGTGRVPDQTSARLPELFGVVLHQTGVTDYRIALDHAIAVGDKIGAPPGDFVVAVGHLIPQAKSDREIRLELDLILDIPGPLQSAEAKARQERDYGNLCRTVGEECLKGRIGDGRPSQRR
jgi:hypothetical protein